MELDPRLLAAGVRLAVLDVIGSTSTEALARAHGGARGPLWITARAQTAGRGRRGRPWHSPAGNLHASLLLTDACAPAQAPELSFVAALALYDALVAAGPSLQARLRLKWPNDVLLDGAKLAGILIEGETLAGGNFAAVLGFGLNCAHHPGDAGYPACDLAGAGVAAMPEHIFPALACAVDERITQWGRGAGFAAVREAWLARATGLGQPIRVRSSGRDLDGRFLGLDGAGRLVLGLPDGATRALSAAEVLAPAAPVQAHLHRGESL